MRSKKRGSCWAAKQWPRCLLFWANALVGIAVRIYWLAIAPLALLRRARSAGARAYSWRNGSLFLGLLLSLPACYENVEGCLDPAAINYDLAADEACSANACCNYPSLRFALTTTWGGEPLVSDSFYQDAFSNRFQLSRLRYYFSEIGVVNTAGDILYPMDSLEMGIASNGDTLFSNRSNNLALFTSRSSASRSLGVLASAPEATAFTALLGLGEAYQAVLPATLPTNHPLYFQEGRMYYGPDSGFVQLKLEYLLISGPDTLARSVEVFGRQPISLPFGTTLVFPKGFHVLARLEAELSLLLNSVNLADANASIAARLSSNASGMFRVRELVGER